MTKLQGRLQGAVKHHLRDHSLTEEWKHMLLPDLVNTHLQLYVLYYKFWNRTFFTANKMIYMLNIMETNGLHLKISFLSNSITEVHQIHCINTCTCTLVPLWNNPSLGDHRSMKTIFVQHQNLLLHIKPLPLRRPPSIKTIFIGHQQRSLQRGTTVPIFYTNSKT